MEIIPEGSVHGTLDDVVAAYKLWLEVKAPDHFAAFARRLKSDAEAARAEAALFSLLRAQDLNPFPAEDPSTGGADFICSGSVSENPIVVEVTIVRAEAIAAKSGLAKKLDPKAGPRTFSLVTDAFRRKAVAKAAQLKDQTAARVLVISLEHDWADILMGSLAAKFLMTGDAKISVPIRPAPCDTKSVTSLDQSAFFRFAADGSVEPCRRSISAVLLASLWRRHISAIGLLHPEPVVTLDYTRLFPIPFLAVSNWPLHVGDVIKTDWRIPEVDPDPHVFAYQPPSLSEADLRQ
jgi:hypothetical protein